MVTDASAPAVKAGVERSAGALGCMTRRYARVHAAVKRAGAGRMAYVEIGDAADGEDGMPSVGAAARV